MKLQVCSFGIALVLCSWGFRDLSVSKMLVCTFPSFCKIKSHSRSEGYELMIDLVLATDMKQHIALLASFGKAHRIAPSTENKSHSSYMRSRSAGAAVSNKGNIAASTTQLVVPLDESERLMSLQVALKMADLGHLSAKLEVHLKWVTLLEEEFFLQGDSEMAKGLPVSTLSDRTKQGISKTQVGFFELFAIPMYDVFSQVFPGTKMMLHYVMQNYKYWVGVELEAAKTKKP